MEAVAAAHRGAGGTRRKDRTVHTEDYLSEPTAWSIYSAATMILECSLP